jgi:glycosyltransferase involved in cell wall biosynthesis
MLDVSVIILTYNEEIHIRRCLENVKKFAKEVFIIDSYSTDKTLEIAKEYGAVILQNKWENNYAKQLNWGLKNAPIKSKWILRLDADEYLMSELIEELNRKLPALADDITGVIFNRRHIFMGKWMKRGIYPVKLLRLFQTGKGVCEQRLMDEHIQLLEGRAVEFEHDFCDHNLNDLSWFCHKHVNYAIREAVDLLDIELDLTGAAETDENKHISAQALSKRMKKHRYAKQPLFWRSFAYFCYRYFLKGACLDGKIA